MTTKKAKPPKVVVPAPVEAVPDERPPLTQVEHDEAEHFGPAAVLAAMFCAACGNPKSGKCGVCGN